MSLKRVVEEKDLPKIKEILMTVFQKANYQNIERLGGMTNHAYKVTFSDQEIYLVRIPGEGTQALINRKDEYKSTKLACDLGIDTDLIYFDDFGNKVMHFIDHAQELDCPLMQKDEQIRQIAEIFRKLHFCGKDTGVPFEVFEMANAYEKIIFNNQVVLYDDYDAIKKQIMEIKQSVDQKHSPVKVPSHNDSLIGNWILDQTGKLWLVDWEYSGMNEEMWDLSCTSIELEYDEKNDEDLLRYYFGHAATVEQKQRFIAAKLYVDYLWTLWGLTRVPFDGEFMQNYADERYARLKKNLKAYAHLGGNK